MTLFSDGIICVSDQGPRRPPLLHRMGWKYKAVL